MLHTFTHPAGPCCRRRRGRRHAALAVAAGWSGAHIVADEVDECLEVLRQGFVSNWFASIGEDLAVFAGLWAALAHPVIFLILLVLFLLALWWLLPKVWRGVKTVFRKIASLFGRRPENPSPV